MIQRLMILSAIGWLTGCTHHQTRSGGAETVQSSAPPSRLPAFPPANVTRTSAGVAISGIVLYGVSRTLQASLVYRPGKPVAWTISESSHDSFAYHRSCGAVYLEGERVA